MSDLEIHHLCEILIAQAVIILRSTVSTYYIFSLIFEVMTLITGMPPFMSDRWLLFIAVLSGLFALIG